MVIPLQGEHLDKHMFYYIEIETLLPPGMSEELYYVDNIQHRIIEKYDVLMYVNEHKE